jgi:hypothetical protein
VDFKQHISATINRTAVMLTVIGAHWANRSWWMPRWFRWLGSAEDFVRSEIEAALDAGVPIIPVLIDGASMPTVGKLPSSISELAFLNAATVRGGHDFHPDMNRVMNRVQLLRAQVVVV